MKKISKILLPIASTVAVAAPMTCLTSCGVIAQTDIKTEFYIVSNELSIVFPANDDGSKWKVDKIQIFDGPIAIKDLKCSAELCPRNESKGRLIIKITGEQIASYKPVEGDKFTFWVEFVSQDETSTQKMNLYATHTDEE